MEYSNTARQIQVEVVRQPDGTAKLKLSSRTPISDPFVDLVIDANWSAGHLARSYTLLLDPPAAQRAAPAATTTPQLSASAPSPTAKPAPAPTAASTGRTYSSDGAAQSAPAAAPAAAGNASSGSVTVRAGDTAGRIAGANRPTGVSLDQMLVAMLRANPNAFINGNVNRIRAGSVVQMPSKEEASTTSAKEARQIVAAQSRDFNEFRRRLAAKAPEAKVASAERTASGQVQAQVQDSGPAGTAADKLTLSKGALPSQHAAEEKLAQAKQATAQTDRVDELQRNLSELQKVASASAPAGAAPASAGTDAATPPGVAVPVAGPGTEAPAATDAATATPAPATTDTPSAEAAAAAPPAAPAPAPAEAPKPAVTPIAAAPAAEPGFLESLTGDNPLILPTAGGALALLLGLIGWNVAKRRKGKPAADTADLHHDEQSPDSFFGSSGGQQIDTRQSSISAASTMAYSPSQLDAGGDVDPVAEAEVYLAYGRDVQAEEILKEALRTQPERLGVHMKLAEIYAKRKDVQALEATAHAVQPLTQGTGPSWERIAELGYGVDPSNPLYQSAAAPAAPSTSAFADALAKSHGMPSATVPKAAAAATAAAAGATLTQHLPADLDLSLDMDLPDGLTDRAEHADDIAGPSSVLTPSDQDFAALEPNWGANAAPAPASAPAAAMAPVAAPPLDLSTLEFSLDDPVSAPAAAPAPAAIADMGLNLDDLNLDLGDVPTAAPAANVMDDPLATKLDLAREFHAIGDSEGARTLVEEVIAEATGELKASAQRLLSEID